MLIDDDLSTERAGRAVPRLRRARPSLPRRGLRHAGARGDGLRPARDRHRRRPHRRVLPGDAGWRIHARRVRVPEDRIDTLETHGRPWVLEPDRRASGGAAAPGRCRRRRRARRPAGRAGRAAAAEPLLGRGGRALPGADHRAGRAPSPAGERRRARALPARGGGRPAACSPRPPGAVRIVSASCWPNGWRRPPARRSACLYLLADPGVDGEPEDLEAHILSAAEAAGVDIEGGADINVLMEPAVAERDVRLHAAVDAYVAAARRLRGPRAPGSRGRQRRPASGRGRAGRPARRDRDRRGGGRDARPESIVRSSDAPPRRLLRHVRAPTRVGDRHRLQPGPLPAGRAGLGAGPGVAGRSDPDHRRRRRLHR